MLLRLVPPRYPDVGYGRVLLVDGGGPGPLRCQAGRPPQLQPTQQHDQKPPRYCRLLEVGYWKACRELRGQLY